MIKDKIIQKRIKGKVLAVAMTAVVASLFVPVRADAADEIPATVTYDKKIEGTAFTGGPDNKAEIATGCSGSGACTGHIITTPSAVSGGTQGVLVSSGHHYIKLEDANIETSASVLEVRSGASVTLVLSGESKLESGAAGICVKQGATLNIMEESESSKGTLKVRSTGEAAAIGGQSIGDAATAGTINIESGTIIAQGGNRSAGIGGSGRGTVESIKINGGTVVAKGGDGEAGDPSLPNSSKPTGAPGIGHGNIGAGGNIVINNGNVTAIGGDHHPEGTGHAMGISGANVTSAGGGKTVIVSDGINPQTNNVNALVWDLTRDPKTGKLQIKGASGNTDADPDTFLDDVLGNGEVKIPHGKVCTVYGTVEMPVGFEKEFSSAVSNKQDGYNKLYIPSGASFKVPDDAINLPGGFDFYGILQTEENSMIVNPDLLHFQGGDQSVDENTRYKIAFNPLKDINMKGPFTYKGEAYQSSTLPDNEIFEVNSIRSVLIDGKMRDVPIDIEGLKCEFAWSSKETGSKPDIAKEGVKHAGIYIAKFAYGTTKHEEEFTIEKLPITDSGVTIDRIPDKEFKNKDFDNTDFNEKEVVVRYKDVQLDANVDYSWYTQGQKNVTDAATLTIQGGRNFSGTRDVSFRITARAMTDENTEIILKSGSSTWKTDKDGNYTTVYDGNQHIPDSAIEKATVKISETESLDVDGINFDMKCSAETEESKYVDAGTITVTITPKTKNFTGECKKTFIIKPRPIEVKSITPVETRPYNGAANIRINEIEADVMDPSGDNANNIIWGRDGTADRPIELPTGVEGIIAEGGNALDIAVVKDNDQEYEEVYINDDVTLAGKGGRNYTIGGKLYTKTGNGNDNQILKNGIKITAREAPVIASITGEATPDEAEPPKFSCNLVITTKEGDVIDPNSIIYCYRCEADEEPPEDLSLWDQKALDRLTYEKLAPNHEERFYIRIGGTRNVAAMDTPVPCTVSIPKYPRKDGPTDCSLTASDTPNENGETYKLTVTPEQEFSATLYPEGRYLYSLSEEGPYTNQPSTLFDNVAPNTEYTAYVKYAATDEYTESETGTPTNSVKTGEGTVQKPTVTCNGTTQSEGEIHFTGTASVSLEYTGAIGGTEIRYTVDGTQPTVSSTLYEGAFDVSDSVTLNAFVVKPGVANSAVTSVKLVKDGDTSNNPSSGTEVELQRLTEETAPALLAATELPGKGIATFDAVSTPLATPILQQRGYENNNITYADLKIKIKGTDRYATEEDFRNAGGKIKVTVTIDQLKAIGLPASYDGTTHNFAVTHMFATGANTGNVETIGTAHNFMKSQDGKSISFDMTSTSPVAFGWADVNNSDPNPVDPGNSEDPGNTEDPGNQDPGNQDPGNQNPTNDPNTIVGEGDPGNASRNGTGTTTGTDAGTQGASNDAANALSGIMPKTGDPLSFVPWIAAIVISAGAIGFFATRKGKKKQSVKKTQATKKKK